jgi:hypothetical protein
MVFAAALISLTVLESAGDPQSAGPQSVGSQPAASRPAQADTSAPYTVQGVRRAMASTTGGGAQPVVKVQPRQSVPATLGNEPLRRSYSGYSLTVTSDSPQPSSRNVVRTSTERCWNWTAYPTWHEQFLAMTGPQYYTGPYYGINIGFSIRLRALERRIAKFKADWKLRKVEKVRAEIRAELAELERVNAAARAAAHPPETTTSPIR